MVFSPKNPTVVIVCRAISANKPPMNSPYYLAAYSDLLLSIKSHGGEAYFSTHEEYTNNGIFKQAYTLSSHVPVTAFQLVENIQADLVYNKGTFETVTDVPILNPSYVHTITANKYETYRHFASYQPLSIYCRNSDDAFKALMKITSSTIVIKKPTGNGGHGVAIMLRDQLDIKDVQYPFIIQEFITTDVGIPAMVTGIHDLRIKIGGGEIWAGTLRTPAEGELRANVAQGGTERHLFPEEIPVSALAIAKEIDQFFANYPRYYSIDLANTPNGWKLIELNSKPGLSPTDMSPQSMHTTDKLAQYLVRLARQHRHAQLQSSL